LTIYKALKQRLPEIQDRTGAETLFEARVFADVSLAAAALSRRILA
jgi:hypothetical protein